MRLWIDDVRPMPNGFDHWAKTADEATAYVLSYGSGIEHISFDHDLGPGDKNNGYTVAVLIEYLCYRTGMKCPSWDVHSANPVGRQRIEQTMSSAQRFSIISNKEEE